eukprot:GHVU01017169.1.p1 GENE.GHVU01017169.1~~GHVU01017169.1.p1  ORF type:complete len:125 (-),score=31.68 GHVU01017169.1:623-997(-)
MELQGEAREKGVDGGKPVKLKVKLERDVPEGEELGAVHAPFYPKEKEEQWWLILGEYKNNMSMAVKRVNTTQAITTVNVEFEAPDAKGEHELTLYLMSDSYLGCDQEHSFNLKVLSDAVPDEDE